MKQADHNPTFTAADIERYYAGTLSMQERHALEKAALDDPFLADALEGYQHTPTPQVDLAILEQQIANKVDRKRVYPLFVEKPWIRVAALFLLLAGAGWTVYQFSFTKKENLAITRRAIPEKQEAQRKPDPTAMDSSAAAQTQEAQTPTLQSEKRDAEPAAPKTANKPTRRADDAIAGKTMPMPVPVAITSAPAENKLSLKAADVVAEKEEAAFSPAKDQTALLNTFKGRILDTKGNPVPNASVIVNGKPIGTTTNIQGQFSLTTPDTALNMTIAAIGFETNRIAFKHPEDEKTVVLNESSTALNEVVITGYGVKRNRSARPSAAQTKAEIEDLEPENGWSSFNNYITENIQIPEEATSKQLKGEVELSFEVNKNGEPVNIKVEKSLCVSCDKEAIRLLQEGPGWKKKKRKSGKVKIRF
jgi:outer membrane biosynthesis protein TonB